MSGQKAALCCPPTAVNGNYPRPRPDSSKDIPTTPGWSCENPLFISDCAPAPEPITVVGQDCDGNDVPVTGLPGQVSAVVQAPGTVFKVQLCDNAKDYEKVILCDVNTKHKVAVITDFTDPTNPVVSYWDINTGAPWTGDVDDLEACADTDTESDAVEMCDAGTVFLRWVVKANGVPTGVVFDTGLDGAPYVVSDPAGVTVGKCEASCAKAPLGVVTYWAI